MLFKRVSLSFECYSCSVVELRSVLSGKVSLPFFLGFVGHLGLLDMIMWISIIHVLPVYLGSSVEFSRGSAGCSFAKKTRWCSVVSSTMCLCPEFSGLVVVSFEHRISSSVRFFGRAGCQYQFSPIFTNVVV